MYRRSAQIEKEVRMKLESLLPDDFEVVKASKYTESEEEFKDKLLEPPTDYYIDFQKKRIAALEVSEGAPGYTYATTRFLKVSERKVQTAEKLLPIPSYMIFVLSTEAKEKPEHFMWCEFDRIKHSYSETENIGRGYKKEEEIFRVPKKFWKLGLESLVDEFSKAAIG